MLPADRSPRILLVDDDRAALYALSEVLCDLPQMDGFEVAAAIRSLERLRRTPIIFMSAYEDRRRKPRPGAIHERYLRKPLAPERVREAVASLLPPARLERGLPPRPAARDPL